MVRILVVDDDDDLREVCRRTLYEAGYLVDTAINGMDALKKLDASSYDLVVTDVSMPELDGIGLYLSCLKRHPYLSERFLFMTGNISEDNAKSVLSRMKKRILIKPFNFNELLDIVSKLK